MSTVGKGASRAKSGYGDLTLEDRERTEGEGLFLSG
jgi:hypothetical protein